MTVKLKGALDKLSITSSPNLLKKKKKVGIFIPCWDGYWLPGGHSHMSVDIKCLSIDPRFLRRSYTQWPPFFYSVLTQWHPFFHFCIKFYIKIANFSALRAHFEKFNDFVQIWTENLQILPWNCIFAHRMTPIFGSPHQKSPHFFGAHTEWPPSFDEILHWTPPIFVLR